MLVGYIPSSPTNKPPFTWFLIQRGFPHLFPPFLSRILRGPRARPAGAAPVRPVRPVARPARRTGRWRFPKMEVPQVTIGFKAHITQMVQ